MMQKRILCFGDSNTWGAIPASTERHPADIRWTGVMQRVLGPDYLIVEEGYNGRTTVFDDPVEGRLSGITYFGPCLDTQSPLDLVILMLGTNDLKVRFQVDPFTIAHGFNRYLRALQVTPMAGRKPQLALAAPILIDPSYRNDALFCDMFGAHADERSQQFAPTYRAFSEAAGIPFLNAADYAGASIDDGIHMDAQSHEKLGCAFAEAVRKILSA